MRRRSNGQPEVFRGKRKRLNLLGMVLSLLAVLLVAAIVAFYSFQRHIVYSQDGISLELPILATPAVIDEDGTRVFAPVQISLSFDEADYSAVEAEAGEDLNNLRAIYIPAASISDEGIAKYKSFAGQYNANALVLEVKPASGQLVWASTSSTAAAYGTGGSYDLGGAVNALKEEGFYLVAQVNCFQDALLSSRSLSSALRSVTGGAYADADGVWLDPYNTTVRSYLQELCLELGRMGFDEILLRSVCMPVSGGSYMYGVTLSYPPTPTTAVCGFARTLNDALGKDGPRLSAMLDSESYRARQADVSGQNIDLFCKVFDRLCCHAPTVWQYTVDRDNCAWYMELGELSKRFVPLMAYAPEGVQSYIVQIPDALLG